MGDINISKHRVSVISAEPNSVTCRMYQEFFSLFRGEFRQKHVDGFLKISPAGQSFKIEFI